jgi:hypothetical protein
MAMGMEKEQLRKVSHGRFKQSSRDLSFSLLNLGVFDWHIATPFPPLTAIRDHESEAHNAHIAGGIHVWPVSGNY